MSTPTSIRDVDLRPVPGKQYFSVTREWREEFIYFLLVDRFHDGTVRRPHHGAARSRGSGTPAQLAGFCGGKLARIAHHLDYIAGLGCTAIWLSPIFENNPTSYHGYAIQNYLDVDPRFGTKQDLCDLVDAAHARDMRVILDVVINHSGDNWQYPFDAAYEYAGDQQFPLAAWRRPDRPVPVELRNPDFYHRRGRIRDSGWDSYPESQHGDLYALKDYDNDDDADGSALLNVLIRAHAYWIREADVDGFRVDAVKHLGELAAARFCSSIREYAYGLGKRRFFLFGEIASNDGVIDRYIGQNTSRQDGDRTVFFGLDSVLDFPLSWALPDVIKGLADPAPLFARLEAQRNRALNRGEIGRYLVTFLDNHDQIGKQPPRRFAAGVPDEQVDEQVIAGIGYLLCALGTPCLYYGTEQGFSGQGGTDQIREAMFDLDAPGVDHLDPECRIYQQIGKIAAVVRATPALRFGRMYFREISGDGVTFGLPFGTDYTLAFSRILYGQEVLVAYNVSSHERADYVIVDGDVQRGRDAMRFLYGAAGSVPIDVDGQGRRFVRLRLGARQFVVLA